MLDDVFLKQYIEFLTIAKKKFGHLALLDKDFNIIFISDLALVSFQDAIEEDVIGLNFIKEIPRPIHLITKKQKILNEVLHLKEPRMYIAIASHNQYKYRKVVICASPICNPETKNVIHFMWTILDLT